MRILTPTLIASLLLLQPILCLASELVSIPSEIAVKMKKGKKLDLVWAIQDFDGTKGFKLGRISNESEDEADVVMEAFPATLSKLIKKDSPYSLHLAVIASKLKSINNGPSNARIEVEGRLVDQAGAIMAAFTARASESMGGNERDSARLAVRTIVFAMTKDLFPSSLPTNEKNPAVIVAAPVASMPPAPVVSASPAPAGSLSQAPVRPVPGAPTEDKLLASTSTPGPAVPSAPAQGSPQPPPAVVVPAPPSVALQPEPSLVPSHPKAVMPLLPVATVANMKKGSALGQIWISPGYDKARGFSIGEVLYRTETRNDGVDQYLPEALAEIAKQDAPCSLQLHIVELTYRFRGKGGSSAQLGVQGVLIAKDGTLLAAFSTRENVAGTGDVVEDCRTAARKVILAITKDLL